MNAPGRIAVPHCGHRSGSTAKICREDLPHALGPASPRVPSRERHRRRNGGRCVRGSRRFPARAPRRSPRARSRARARHTRGTCRPLRARRGASRHTARRTAPRTRREMRGSRRSRGERAERPGSGVVCGRLSPPGPHTRATATSGAAHGSGSGAREAGPAFRRTWRGQRRRGPCGHRRADNDVALAGTARVSGSCPTVARNPRTLERARASPRNKPRYR